MARFDPGVHGFSRKCGPNVCGGVDGAPLAAYGELFLHRPTLCVPITDGCGFQQQFATILYCSRGREASAVVRAEL